MHRFNNGISSEKLRLIGFTLAEILVALALIALLAAVLLPTVAGQILKGDTARVSQDLEAVRSGIEQFLADVHRYPGKYSDLSKAIVNTDTDINGATYPDGLVNKWGGPYVTKDTFNATIATGFGATILNTFSKTLHTNGANYVTVSISGIDSLDFYRLDEAFDGAGDSTKGRLRWSGGTTKYLAIPIQ